ncbi:DinB family protein [Gryllotalpicola daejeonensis]|uniref:DinB family protein n=1 Tax=Gryllotalpicola daejeonensis TaxID=993087 RepID=A0ABP7ZKX0_9MICO
MPIVPDTKNWTWVLERACPECGFDPDAIDYRDVPRLTREAIDVWRQVLAGDGIEARPDDATWSPLEYGAHTRDVFRIMLARLNLMLVLVDPELLNWDQDETAELQNYRAQDPARVTAELAAAGNAIAEAFELVPDADLGRTGRRTDGSRFTVETLAKYFVHDVVHHRWDVTRERAVSVA